MFTDTGSLVYEIETSDVYEGFYEDKDLFGFSDILKDSNFYEIKDLFDFSDILKDSKFFDKKVIGKRKDGFKGKIISEFVGLKSKDVFFDWCK